MANLHTCMPQLYAPAKVIQVANPFPPPDGIQRDRLSEQDLDDMPVLRDLQTLKAQNKR